ncbi:chromate efflux transporter [Limisalsivibrio acetivorans]|uniref:chromate efflux transporter n=1 Tax=Limisalsivibrio acetivorans TaxID=1304888 RepID=UPI0003B63BD8|nr:chromate efflux transporter [Limisalsivibrio acetivorans]
MINKQNIRIFYIFLSLGLRSFGGPVAHMGYFHKEFVQARKWLDEKEFADITAMCQFLPGPASSQTGFSIGLRKGGMPGAFAAWLGFTLPSVVVMVLAAYGLSSFSFLRDSFIIPGLLMLTVAVVAQAVWSMGSRLCTDNPLRILAATSAFAVLVTGHPLIQVLVILCAGGAGYLIYNEPTRMKQNSIIPYGRSATLLGIFFTLLVALPAAAALSGNESLRLFEIFYRAGAIVFGGGHVVLPLLQAETAGGLFLGDDTFLSGYGIAQLVPGPLFTFSAFVGTTAGGFITGLVCLLGIFMSTFLLVPAVLPIWDHLSAKNWASASLKGVNAGVVGILLAALYNPVWVKGVHSSYDFAVCMGAFAMLKFAKAPIWATALFCIAMAYFRQA